MKIFVHSLILTCPVQFQLMIVNCVTWYCCYGNISTQAIVQREVITDIAMVEILGDKWLES